MRAWNIEGSSFTLLNVAFGRGRQADRQTASHARRRIKFSLLVKGRYLNDVGTEGDRG